MKYYLIAGEASGDLHASNLIAALRRKDQKAEFAFIGGDLMQKASETSPDFHYSGMNFMGLFSVLANLGRLRYIMRSTRAGIVDFQPDVLILIDYAGFNLRMAKYAFQKGIRVFYYIPPKVWAWRKSRVKKLKKYVSKVFIIFPFERDFYRSKGVKATYVGNPLMDSIALFQKELEKEKIDSRNEKTDGRPVIAFLAGSRKMEISNCLPEMIKASKHFPDYRFVVAGAPSVSKEHYEKVLDNSGVDIVYNETYLLLSKAQAAVVTSGTATLETALLNIPQIVIYKTGGFTFVLGRIFVRFKFFSLVNLLLDRELIKEFLQYNLAEKIRFELDRILKDNDYRSSILQGYEDISGLVGKPGVSDRLANEMLKLLTE
ncbi:lipid-A-disaccharide synthase [Bacteroidota bacterium]